MDSFTLGSRQRTWKYCSFTSRRGRWSCQENYGMWILLPLFLCLSLSLSLFLSLFFSLSVIWINEYLSCFVLWYSQKQPTVWYYLLDLDTQKGEFSILYLSLSQHSPFILWGNLFNACGRFSTPSFYHLWSRSARIPQQPQSIFVGAHFYTF